MKFILIHNYRYVQNFNQHGLYQDLIIVISEKKTFKKVVKKFDFVSVSVVRIKTSSQRNSVENLLKSFLLFSNLQAQNC
jgi:hypothetical protein